MIHISQLRDQGTDSGSIFYEKYVEYSATNQFLTGTHLEHIINTVIYVK